MFEHKTFIRFVDESFEKGLDIVCLSIVQTEGSTYQKPGSTMLVNSAHEMVGVLSGGCIEEALLHCCDEVLQKGVGKFVTHDLRLPDDSLQSWEEGIGCNGLIQVWLEPFYYAKNYSVLGEAVSYAKQGTRVIFHRSLEGKAPFIETETVHQPMMYDEVHHTLIQPIEPCFKVLILGVGSAVQAVVDMANILGWQTYVCDTRADALDVIVNADEKRLFSSATECETLLGKERFDACVIMSHLFKADSAYLKSALHSKASYIGLLGSKTRSHKIIESLGENITLDERFHAPIGLGIGSKTPQAIALAICAQIESEKNKRV